MGFIIGGSSDHGQAIPTKSVKVEIMNQQYSSPQQNSSLLGREQWWHNNLTLINRTLIRGFLLNLQLVNNPFRSDPLT